MEFDFIILDETESTNSEALKLAKSTDRPTFIVAKKQTNGRGRTDRSWSDPSGNFSGSILVKIDEDLQNLALRSFVAALSVFDAIEQKIGKEHELLIKWPKDVISDIETKISPQIGKIIEQSGYVKKSKYENLERIISDLEERLDKLEKD
tara:strand:+ start:231 stop:680 length:450 start_codon:yes stop_codon:yes gene_type:complete